MAHSLLPARPALAGIISSLAIVLAMGCEKKFELPPPEVYTQAATKKDVPIVMELVGQTTGSQDVEIRARVEGFLQGIHYKEGLPVKKGDLLFTIDPRPFESVVAQRRSDLASAEARLHLADQEVNRLKPLAEQQAVSRQSFDSAVSSQKTSKAALDATKAALDNALLDLSYTRITAPTSGLADFAKVKPGNLVGRGDSTLLTTVSNVNPIHVVVGMQEADYLKLVERTRKGTQPLTGQGAATAELILSDEKIHPFSGSFDAIQGAIDPRTGTMSLRVVFPNPDNLVRPGQFAKVRFNVDNLKGAVVVPQQAVQDFQGAQQVVVVEGGKAVARAVKMGPRYKNEWVVLEGLESGEIVVIEGLQQAKPGAVVVAKPYVPAQAKGEGVNRG